MNTTPPQTERRILIVDDNPAIHDDFRKILAPPDQQTGLAAAKAALFGAPAPRAAQRASCRIDSALQGSDALELVLAARQAGTPYQVVFCDMRMPPGWDGPTTIKHLWEVDPKLQVVICTAYADGSLDQISDDLGHSDRLLILKKPFDNAEIVQLATALGEKWLAEQSARLKLDELERLVQVRTAEIEHAMLHDKLTGLPNRMLLNTRLEACIQRRARNSACKFALLFLDFDRFKLVNDSLGHEVGDLLLIEIACRLQGTLRQADVVIHAGTASRLGGDEFIVLLEDLKEERDAARVAERLLAALAEPYSLENQRLHMTASIGIATSDRGYERAGDMIRDADTAMYRAKAAGRARYVMFDRRMHEEVMARLSLESELRKAVHGDEITLHYQPIIRLGDDSLSGFEALVRWSHPQRGPIPATELIAVAEDTGLIQPLSLNVLNQACRQLRHWHDAYPAAKQLMMSVNLSRKQLIDPELVEKIGRTVSRWELNPGSLILEITESTIIEDRACAIRVFEELKSLGVWLHLDDFGTGYSSLSCLFQLPISGLKIDRQFIQSVCALREHRIVLQSIVNIARAFQLQIVAEGVETTEQFELLRELGVDYIQGFLLGRPTASATAEALLRNQPTLCHTG